MNALDKEEFRIKLEEINKLVQDKDYKGAMNIVDSIDWRRVKNVRTLCVVGEIYAANGRYEDSKEIFLLAYHKASIGKNILYRLIEISLRMDDINEAEEFFEEYKQVASNDSTQYILQYKIARAKNSSLNEQIRILEEYKEQEFTEKWSYELAALYYKAGEKQKCLDLCNEIILWFSEGKYVMKAYDLKMRMGELTGAEKAKFEKQFVPKLLTPEQAKELEKKKTETEVKAQEEPEAEEVEETTENNEPEVQVSMEGIQEKISKGIRDVFGGKTQEEKEEFPEESMDMVNEAGITREDEIPEEIIKSDASQKEPENVPELEAEPEKPGAEPMAAIKMPELNIPASMKNMELSKPPKVEEVAETKLNMDSFDLEGKELNLEDTILAAASAQGIASLTEQLKESISISAEELNVQKENFAQQKKSLSENRDEVHARLEINSDMYEKIRRQQTELLKTETRWKWMKSLSDTANGTITGKARIMLETYIQMQYFDRILARANIRLMTMSSGQYELVRRKENKSRVGKTGLELDVVDHYNGTVRSVKTLSGGETFQASLSLALGLSDEIQSSSGGIQLDTMFVDEGFGSLDEDALDQAIRALKDLSQGSRLVGIVSHVAELKERIDKKIIVTKKRTEDGVGSTICIEG